MNVQSLGVTQDQAIIALRDYKMNRGVYDKRDWEIERIYRQIARGKTVIVASDAIRSAGVDANKRPRLAICQADAEEVIMDGHGDHVMFGIRSAHRWSPVRKLRIDWSGIGYVSGKAKLPRIPPQYRPAKNLGAYHLLWEADWAAIPRDPYLLRRIGKDAWVVLAAWDLTDVEMSVLRAHHVH